jgi:hypothetical protein
MNFEENTSERALFFITVLCILGYLISLRGLTKKEIIKQTVGIIVIIILTALLVGIMLFIIIGVNNFDDYVNPSHRPLFSENMWIASLVLAALLVFLPPIILTHRKIRDKENIELLNVVHLGFIVLYLFIFFPVTNVLCKKYRYSSCVQYVYS